MTPEELLSQLKEIHEPAAIGVWPLAPGWWVLIIALLCITVLAAYGIRVHIKKNAWKKEAIHTVNLIKSQIDTHPPQQSLQQINQLIKRMAIHKLNDPSISSSTGDEWRTILASLISGAITLTPKQLELLSEGQYKPLSDQDSATHAEIVSLLSTLQNWIKGA